MSTFSRSSGTPMPVLAETYSACTCPPYCSTSTFSSASCCRMRSGLASSRSILLMATTMGTPAAFEWLMASFVCGITWSSAATTRMTRSVTWAPRARMAVNASWPGVSRNVIGRPSFVSTV